MPSTPDGQRSTRGKRLKRILLLGLGTALGLSSLAALGLYETIQSWTLEGLTSEDWIQEDISDPHVRHFFSLVVAGDVDAVLAEAKTIPGGVNVAGTQGLTPLFVATRHQDLTMVRALLKAGARPDGAGIRWIPLEQAAFYGQRAIVRTLLKAGANPDGPPGSSPPLAGAAQSDDRAMVDILLNAGAHINAADDAEETPIISAAISGSIDIVNYFLDRGASLWDASQFGFTIANTGGTDCLDGRMTTEKIKAACQDFIARLQAAHYPWPPPTVQEVGKMLNNGQWPPREAHP
jgi:hypothetical protein